MATPRTAVVLGVLAAVVGGCNAAWNQQALTASEYREQANALCAGEARAIAAVPGPEGPSDMHRWIRAAYERSQAWAERRARLEPPERLAALHDRATRLTSRNGVTTRRTVRELRSVYSKLELSDCADLFSVDEESDPEACREIVSAVRDAHEERRSWAEDARAEAVTVKELEEEIRTAPESRAAAQPDLDSSRRLLAESKREVKKAAREVERQEQMAREEGCGG